MMPLIVNATLDDAALQALANALKPYLSGTPLPPGPTGVTGPPGPGPSPTGATSTPPPGPPFPPGDAWWQHPIIEADLARWYAPGASRAMRWIVGRNDAPAVLAMKTEAVQRLGMAPDTAWSRGVNLVNWWTDWNVNWRQNGPSWEFSPSFGVWAVASEADAYIAQRCADVGKENLNVTQPLG